MMADNGHRTSEFFLKKELLFELFKKFLKESSKLFWTSKAPSNQSGNAWKREQAAD